ncbi:hypothetical protein Tco_1435751, partial [Tanacetum coccineum]
GSIVTGYLAEELIEFGNDVVKGVRNIGIPHSRHEGRLAGVGTIGLRMIDPARDALKVAHSVVLRHMSCLTPYIEQHKQMLRATHRGRTNKWYQRKHNEEFSYWLKDIVIENLGQPNVDKMVERSKVFFIGFFLRRFFKEAVSFGLLISHVPLFDVAGLDWRI